MNSRFIEVRYASANRVVMIVVGGLMLAIGVVAMVELWWDLQFLVGAGIANIAIGIWMTSKPYCSYDAKAKTVVVYWGGTRRVRWTFGAGNDERLYVEDGRIRRIGPDGKAKFVVLGFGLDRADRKRLIQVIESQDRSRQTKERNKRR